MTERWDLCIAEHRREPDRPRPALDGMYLCFGCASRFAEDLGRLPGLYAQLADILSGTSGGGQRVSGTSAAPLPINPAVAEHRQQIQHDLTWWCLHVAGHRGIRAPASPLPATTGPWLGKHADWIAANRAGAEECPMVMRELVGRAWGLINPDGAKRIKIGPCIAVSGGQRCTGQLYATVRREDDPRPSAVYCDNCDFEKPPIEWLRFGRTYGDRHATA